MFRAFFAGVLVATPITLTVGSGPWTETETNPIAHEPVVLYEVTGGTLLGPYDLQLTVYADGLARLSSAGMFGQPPRAALRDVGPEVAGQLAQELGRVGAFTMLDQTTQVTDVPLHTLTLLNGTPDSPSHTYSWWIPEGSNQTAPEILQHFITKHFEKF